MSFTRYSIIVPVHFCIWTIPGSVANFGQLKDNPAPASVRQVQDYRRELRLVQATASAQKASRKLADKTHSMSSKIVNMETSLERIKQTQHDVADQIEAMAQVNVGLSDQTLDERIVAAGISGAKDPAEEVLKRLRDKAKSGNS